MPQGDGTGPRGGSLGTGRRQGRMGGSRPGAGPGGVCVCPQCGAQVAHQPGVPCYQAVCPKCGAQMVRGVAYKFFDSKIAGGWAFRPCTAVV